MIAKFLLVLSFSISSITSFSQNTFSLSDSTFKIGQAYIIKNIYFDMNNGRVLLDSTRRKTLDSIADFLKNNKGFNFEVGVHTDSRGSDKYNLMLSDRRAKSLKKYLLSEGAYKEQLTSKGYGENQPIHSKEKIEANPQQDTEATNEMHRENRRVVLMVTSQAFPFQYTFDLSDSTFEVGETFTTRGIRFELNKVDLIIDEITKPLLDSLVAFFNDHPQLRIELGRHSSSLGQQYRSSSLCEVRARALYDYFIDQGVNKVQLMPVCYGSSMPIHRDPYINQFKEKDRGKFQQLHMENRRVVLTILAIN